MKDIFHYSGKIIIFCKEITLKKIHLNLIDFHFLILFKIFIFFILFKESYFFRKFIFIRLIIFTTIFP